MSRPSVTLMETYRAYGHTPAEQREIRRELSVFFGDDPVPSDRQERTALAYELTRWPAWKRKLWWAHCPESMRQLMGMPRR